MKTLYISMARWPKK